MLRHISQAFSTDYFPRSRQLQLYKHLSLRGMRVPEPTSRLRHGSLSTERRLMRMVEQNGGKLRRLKKIIKKSRFVGIKNFYGEHHCLMSRFGWENKKKIVMGTLTWTSSSLVRTLSSLPALKSPMTLCAHAGSTSMQFATSRHPPTSPMCAPGLDSSIRCHTPLLPMSAFCHFANY